MHTLSFRLYRFRARTTDVDSTDFAFSRRGTKSVMAWKKRNSIFVVDEKNVIINVFAAVGATEDACYVRRPAVRCSPHCTIWSHRIVPNNHTKTHFIWIYMYICWSVFIIADSQRSFCTQDLITKKKNERKMPHDALVTAWCTIVCATHRTTNAAWLTPHRMSR